MNHLKSLPRPIQQSVSYCARCPQQGVIKHGDTEYPSEHPALVSAKLWEEANDALQRRPDQPKRLQQRDKHFHLLKGLLVCEECGTSLTPSPSGKKGNPYLYYSPDAPTSAPTVFRSWHLFAPVAGAAMLFTGCQAIVNQPTGKIVSVTERGIGLMVSQSTVNQSPQVNFGFFSSTVVLLPTTTNGTISSPNFANTFDFAQSSALQLGIGEAVAAGNYQTFQPGQTNTAATTTPK